MYNLPHQSIEKISTGNDIHISIFSGKRVNEKNEMYEAPTWCYNTAKLCMPFISSILQSLKMTSQT